MSDDAARNDEIVRLLVSWKKRRKNRPANYQRASQLVDEVLDRPPAVKRDLLFNLLKAGVASTTIGLDLVSFVDECDLEPLAAKASELADRDGDSDLVLGQIALQRPDAVPTAFRENMLAFKDWRRDGFEPYPPMHVIFEAGRAPSGIPLGVCTKHPTWSLPSAGRPYRLGGAGSLVCRSCGKQAIHILTLDHELPSFPQTRDRIVLETCPNCLGYAYYRHDHKGLPSRIEPIQATGFDWETIPLVQQAVRFAPTPPRWRFQDWAASNSRQNLSRLGGAPSWIQRSDVPKVPGTDRSMRLLLQLDSFLPTIGDGELLWGSGGILYIFWDSETRTSCQIGHWT